MGPQHSAQQCDQNVRFKSLEFFGILTGHRPLHLFALVCVQKQNRVTCVCVFDLFLYSAVLGFFHNVLFTFLIPVLEGIDEGH